MATMHCRTFRIRDAMLMIFIAAIAIFTCKNCDPGWYAQREWLHVLFFMRVAASVVALSLTAFVIAHRTERQTLFLRPGRTTLTATAIAAIIAVGTRWSYLLSDTYSGPTEAFQFMAVDGLLDPNVSPPIYGIASVFAIGLLSRSFLWVMDWIELIGLSCLAFWICTTVFSSWLANDEFMMSGCTAM